MAKISAKVIEDSIAVTSPRLIGVQVTLPRFLLAELNTHRVFSRNYRSSRAVPVSKLIEEVRNEPYEPLVWLKNKPGMQATEQMTTEESSAARREWYSAVYAAASSAENLMRMGLHKQWANRVLEPFLYVHGLITSVQWSNFFALRRHTDAQPEFKALADAIYEAIYNSQPKELRIGQWHLPYVTREEREKDLSKETLIKMSVARVARVSYWTFEGKEPDIEADLRLYDKLVGAVPMHASPCEAQATPDGIGVHKDEWLNPHLHGNYQGWCQWRKFLKGECQ